MLHPWFLKHQRGGLANEKPPFEVTQRFGLNRRHPLTEGLEIVFAMNELGGSVLHSLVGGYVGEIQAAPTWQADFINFPQTGGNANDIEIKTLSGANPSLSPPFSIAFRAKWDDRGEGNSGYIFDSDTGRFIIGHATTNNLAMYDGAWDYGSIDVLDGEWHSVLVVHTGNMNYMWIDGVESINTAAGASKNLGDQCKIGSKYTGTSNEYDGQIKYFYLWAGVELGVEDAILLDREPFAMFEQPAIHLGTTAEEGVTALMDALSGVLTAEDMTLSAGQVTLLIDALTGVLTAEDMTVSMGGLTILMDALTGVTSAAALDLVPGSVAISLNALTGTLTAEQLTVIAVVGQQIAMDALTLAGSAETMVLSPGAVALSMDALTGTLTAEDLTLTLATIIQLLSATLVGSAEDMTPSMGAVQLVMDTLNIAGSAELLNISAAITILMDALTAAGSAESLTVSTAIQILMNALSATGSVQELTLSTGEIQILLDALTGTLEAQNLSTSILTEAADGRSIIVADENRMVIIDAENRTITVIKPTLH